MMDQIQGLINEMGKLVSSEEYKELLRDIIGYCEDIISALETDEEDNDD